MQRHTLLDAARNAGVHRETPFLKPGAPLQKIDVSERPGDSWQSHHGDTAGEHAPRHGVTEQELKRRGGVLHVVRHYLKTREASTRKGRLQHPLHGVASVVGAHVGEGSAIHRVVHALEDNAGICKLPIALDSAFRFDRNHVPLRRQRR